MPEGRVVSGVGLGSFRGSFQTSSFAAQVEICQNFLVLEPSKIQASRKRFGIVDVTMM